MARREYKTMTDTPSKKIQAEGTSIFSPTLFFWPFKGIGIDVILDSLGVFEWWIRLSECTFTARICELFQKYPRFFFMPLDLNESPLSRPCSHLIVRLSFRQTESMK